MNILFDTSVLIAALVEAHPAHQRALPYFQRVKNGIDRGFISAHSLAELYSILTTLPIKPHISTLTAKKLIRSNILENFQILELSESDYEAIVNHLAESGLSGGIIYDALILYAVFKIDIDEVLTLNMKDFQRIYPELNEKIHVP